MNVIDKHADVFIFYKPKSESAENILKAVPWDHINFIFKFFLLFFFSEVVYPTYHDAVLKALCKNFQ